MLNQNQTEQRLEISTNSNQLTAHLSDGVFNLQLGQTLQYKQVKLNQFTFQNLLKNFSGSESNFSLTTSDVGHIEISLDYYMLAWQTSGNFISWINGQLTNAGSGLQFSDVSGHQSSGVRILSPWDLRLAMQTNIGFTCYLQGNGWSKLGFDITSVLYAQTFISQKIPNFGQTSKIYIYITNMQSVISSFVSAQFAIVNNSSFGGIMSVIYPDQNGNQLLESTDESSVNTFQIQIFDDKGELIQTVQGSQNKPTLTMNLSFYKY